MKSKNYLLSAAIAGVLAFSTQGTFAADNSASITAGATQMQAAGNGQTTDINGSKVHYSVSGQGQPMILIHGYPLNSGLFKNQVAALSQNHRLVLLDLPGFGQSKANDDDASLNEYAKTVLGLMDQLKIDKAIIGGHSMGGMTTIEMYKMAPERFSGMILIDTTAKPAPLANQAWWKGFGEQAEQKGVASVATVLVPQMLTGEARMANQELVTYTEGLVKAASLDGIEGGGEALADRPDNSKVLAGINVPTLILVGVQDSLTPVSMAKEMNGAIKDSKLVVIDGASHASVLEQPQQANQAILGWAEQIRPTDFNAAEAK